jgi:2,3-bisphosphoglycerate-independent phosphoglycerate mutase
MDGLGEGRPYEGNAVALANTPVLDELKKKLPNLVLAAHGKAVGMPSDSDMGNSEVGHNAIGAGRVFAQGAKLVKDSIESGAMFEGKAWREVINFVKASGGALHFIGLFSDGNVHSHLDHLKAMLQRCAGEGIKRAFVHALLDGRDVGETSALDYVLPFEEFLAELNSASGVSFALASGGGRMKITMDRYGADWEMVKRGWDIHVHGEGRQFGSAREAIETYRRESPGVIDQDLPGFVVARDGKAIGPIMDGDGVVNFNFRGDRAIEITQAFEYDDFIKFDRGRRPRVCYAGMMQYDGDLQLPSRYLVSPAAIDGTMGELLCREGVAQLALSETQKFGHVTYFWNGNRSGKFDDRLETYIEIPSDRVPFEQRPWMKAAEITDRTIAELRSGKHRLARINYPNGDMVGHTGDLQATIIAVETVDLCLGRLLPVIEELGGVAFITSDHGNADEMYEIDGKGKLKLDREGNPRPKTSHTLNPVPFIVFDPLFKGEYALNGAVTNPGLSNIDATTLMMLGFEEPEGYDPSLIALG